MRKVLFVCVAAALLLGVAANAKADLATPATPDSLTFVLSSWKDNSTVQGINKSLSAGSEGVLSVENAFQFTFSKGEGNFATLTFDYSDLVYANSWESLVGGADTLKFKNFSLYGFESIFASSQWNPAMSDFSPTSNNFTFANDNTWESFVAFVLGEDFDGYIKAHIQSIGSGGASINAGEFTLKGTVEPFSHAPEPATLLILGLGAVGAGLAARRRK